MKRIRTGDVVVVTTGKSKGQTGAVLSFSGEDRVVVDGVNLVKKHQKPNPNAGVQGGIIEQEAPIQLSNVMLLNEETGKGDRVGFRVEGGNKERYFKSNGKAVEQ